MTNVTNGEKQNRPQVTSLSVLQSLQRVQTNLQRPRVPILRLMGVCVPSFCANIVEQNAPRKTHTWFLRPGSLYFVRLYRQTRTFTPRDGAIKPFAESYPTRLFFSLVADPLKLSHALQLRLSTPSGHVLCSSEHPGGRRASPV